MTVPAEISASDAGPIRSFTFIRDEDIVEDVTEKYILVNGNRIDIVPKITSIDMVTLAALALQGGSQSLVGLHKMFKTMVKPESYDRFVGILRELDLRPDEIAGLAQEMMSVYTVRPTQPSSNGR